MPDQKSPGSPVNPTTESPSRPFVPTMDLAFLGSLVPGIIHNMATPLSGVLGAIQLLEKRVSGFESLFQDLDALSESARAEWSKQFERNRTSVDILAKNAKHLADILQVIVHRINRGSLQVPELHSLSDLVRNELQFLEANLNFKHKVKKTIEFHAEGQLARFVYGYVAGTMEEFVSGLLVQHDLSSRPMDMSFVTEADADTVTFIIRAHVAPREETPAASDLLDPYVEQLRADGWTVALTAEPGCRELRLTRPRLVPAS